jgi:hypothetical protein
MPRKNFTIDLAGSGVRFARINADQTTTELTAAQMRTALEVAGTPLDFGLAAQLDLSTTSYVDIPGFTVPVVAGGKYAYELLIHWEDEDADGGVGIFLSPSHPTLAKANGMAVVFTDATETRAFSNNSILAVELSAGEVGTIRLSGTFVAGGAAGTFKWQVRKGTSAGTNINVFTDSRFTVRGG